MEHVSNLITHELETMSGIPGTDSTLQFKRKAISALFPYAVHLAQCGDRGMFDIILNIALKPTSGGSMWRPIGPYIITLFDESSPPYLNQAIVLASPCADWISRAYTPNAVARWSAAVLATPYSEEIGQSVVDALLQIVRNASLRPHLPDFIWEWLKRRPSLPPVCLGRRRGTTPDVVDHIRKLGEIEILKSYFLLVWSEWDVIDFKGRFQMENIIRDEFSGIAMQHHREVLTQRLDYILGELDRGLEYFKQHKPQIDEDHIRRERMYYGRLKERLVEVDRLAMGELSVWSQS